MSARLKKGERVDCPFCGATFSLIGLRQHWCAKAPDLIPGVKINRKGTRMLTRKEWLSAVTTREAVQ